MKKIILATIIFLAVACSTSKHGGGPAGSQQITSGSQRDGSSAEKAIVIRANSESEGVEKAIYFDISGFFGKL